MFPALFQFQAPINVIDYLVTEEPIDYFEGTTEPHIPNADEVDPNEVTFIQ